MHKFRQLQHKGSFAEFFSGYNEWKLNKHKNTNFFIKTNQFH
jgi:hypothetical protein